MAIREIMINARLKQKCNVSTSRNYITTLLPLFALLVAGIIISIYKAPFATGKGDHMLFHAFGHWIANGEVFTRDFIHFRTPGPYYYYGIMQYFFGQTFKTTSLALLLEAHFFQVIAGYFLTLAATKNLIYKNSVIMAFFVGLFFILAPPIYQLRTAMPALALALYIRSFEEEIKPLAKIINTFFSGIFLGISFWFGQELFVFLSLALLCSELSTIKYGSYKKTCKKLSIIALAAILPVISGMLYFFIKGVDIHDLLYNIFYYAFIIQPKGMDTPFPAFSLQNIIYYGWIAAFCVAAFTFTLKKIIFKPASIALFSYTAMRMISMFGRADILHLLFSISEIVILISLTILVLVNRNKDVKNDYFNAIIIVLFFILIFTIAAHGKASILIASPFFLLILSLFKNNGVQRKRENPSIAAQSFSGIATLFLVILMTYPSSYNNIRATGYFFSKQTKNTILGAEATIPRKVEFDKVSEIIDKANVDGIFSYPIRAEFYALTKKHSTRFIEFAPQTTDKDIQGAILDLQKNRPQLVIQDMDQVATLAPILADLSNFIFSNYQEVKILSGDSNLQILKKRPLPLNAFRLFDNAYKYNLNHTNVTVGLRETSNGVIVPVIASNKGSAKFQLTNAQGKIYFKIYPEPNSAQNGTITLVRDGKTFSKVVSIEDGNIEIPIPLGTGNLEVNLKSNDPAKSILWQNPVVSNTPKF